MKQDEVKLLPCPFCGLTNVTLSNGYDEDGNWVVICPSCKSSGTFSVKREIAVRCWNTRADSNQARIAQLEEALRAFGKPRQFPDRLCFCRTVAGLYCVAQPECVAARAALAGESAGEGKENVSEG